MRRAAAAIVVAALGIAGVGARCIENVTVRIDGDGYTYLLGEIYNDTEIQGSEMVLQATLFDGGHNVIATKAVDVMCPGDLAPHSHSAYAVRFDQPGLPPYASYEVRPVAGRALAEPASASGVEILSASAHWTPRTARENVAISVSARNGGAHAVTGVALCGVTYDGEGRVRSVTSQQRAVTIAAGDTKRFDFTLRGQGGAATARAWLWFPGPTPGTSRYLPLITDPLPIIQ
jgi:hypothetical protein